MAKGHFIAYYRVSTQEQGRSGLGLDGQRKAVRDYLNGGNWTLLAEFTEIESGKRTSNRPELARALEQCRMTGAKLVIAKLDRLSRDAAFLIGLEASGIDFVAADMPNANRLTVRLMAVIAQEEREMISARTKAALAAAKARGQALGGWRGGPKPSTSVYAAGLATRQANAGAFAARLRPMVVEMRERGLSLGKIASELTRQGIRTPRDGNWVAGMVLRLLRAEDGIRLGDPRSPRIG
jgi:DNA invertase Pin-like site-specific DNA recombinase